ncbi:MAG: cation:proton antiporter regulatory subunit [Methanomicrobiales archaeon]|nr:cation:proton antiporter regulatory subunit [Methanomicrobiales archaeon]
MAFRSVALPGIGTKYELETDHGDALAIVYLENGSIQLYASPGRRGEACAVELTPPESRRIGSVLTGAIMEAEEEGIEIAFAALADLRISIHTYIVGHAIAGRCIAELQIRSRTGATVIAVSRGEQHTINPSPDFTFEQGDTVVVIGGVDQLQTFEKVILGK